MSVPRDFLRVKPSKWLDLLGFYVTIKRKADYKGVFMYEVAFRAFEKMGIATCAHSYEEMHKNHMNI